MTSNYNAVANLHTLQITTAPAKPFPVCCVFNSGSLATASNTASRAHILLSQLPLHSPTNYFTSLHPTELHSAGLGSSLYSLGVDPTEKTLVDIVTVLLYASLFSGNMFTEPLPSNTCSFSRSLHSNGTTRYSTIWDITPCNPLKVNRRFGETSSPSSGSKNKPNKIPA
jgi:hypothetical protein